jgi:DNA-directed RNA polymerase subunit alpha
MSSADFEIINPDLHLATLDSDDAKLSVELNVEQGLGYVEAGSQKGLPIGTLPMDSVYTPIRKVNYEVETTRIGKFTNYELIDIQIWTDGTMTPIEAITKAGAILVNQFFLFSNIQKVVDDEGEGSSLALSMPVEHYNTVVEELNLSSRTLNCLKRAGLNMVGEVLELEREDLLKIRNFGEKSYRELFEKLREMDLLPQESDPDNDKALIDSDVVSEDEE